MTQTAKLFQLFQAMVQYFDLNELRALSFSLGVDWDTLPGDNKPAKVISLITYLVRRERFDELLVRLREERPARQWPNIDPQTFSDFDVGSFLSNQSSKTGARNIVRATSGGTIKIGGAATQEGDNNLIEADTGGNIEAGRLDQKNRKM